MLLTDTITAVIINHMQSSLVLSNSVICIFKTTLMYNHHFDYEASAAAESAHVNIILISLPVMPQHNL